MLRGAAKFNLVLMKRECDASLPMQTRFQISHTASQMRKAYDAGQPELSRGAQELMLHSSQSDLYTKMLVRMVQNHFNVPCHSLLCIPGQPKCSWALDPSGDGTECVGASLLGLCPVPQQPTCPPHWEEGVWQCRGNVRESPGYQDESPVPWPLLPGLHPQTPENALQTQGRLRRWDVSNQATTGLLHIIPLNQVLDQEKFTLDML